MKFDIFDLATLRKAP